ncbi:HORMA domain protein, partial [Teladorsagia circumcincta]
WLSKRKLKRLVLVISEIKTKEVMERWQFDIQTEEMNEEGENSTRQKDEKKIKQEMSDVIRQITASVTFLPLLEEPCSFDVLIYTGKETEAPSDWVESSACLIKNSEQRFARDQRTVELRLLTIDAVKMISWVDKV